MEGRINSRIEAYISKFKDHIKAVVLHGREDLSQRVPDDLLPMIDDSLMTILQQVLDYEGLLIKPEDYMKRKRSKNNVPLHEQCIAKRANGQQCTRRKKDAHEYCGTHIKGTPHGCVDQTQINGANTSEPLKKTEVWLQDINGIFYWIDQSGNVYDHDEVSNHTPNPKVIAKYEKKIMPDDGSIIYSIPNFASGIPLGGAAESE
jgi:hypothetical protein